MDASKHPHITSPSPFLFNAIMLGLWALTKHKKEKKEKDYSGEVVGRFREKGSGVRVRPATICVWTYKGNKGWWVGWNLGLEYHGSPLIGALPGISHARPRDSSSLV